MKMTMTKIILVTVLAAVVLTAGCILGPDDGYIQGKVLGPQPELGRVYFVESKDQLKGDLSDLMSTPANPDGLYTRAVPGDATYHLAWIYDVDGNGRFDVMRDHERIRREPVYVGSGERVLDIGV